MERLQSPLARFPAEIRIQILESLTFFDKKSLQLTSRLTKSHIDVPLACPDALSWITHVSRIAHTTGVHDCSMFNIAKTAEILKAVAKQLVRSNRAPLDMDGEFMLSLDGGPHKLVKCYSRDVWQPYFPKKGIGLRYCYKTLGLYMLDQIRNHLLRMKHESDSEELQNNWMEKWLEARQAAQTVWSQLLLRQYYPLGQRDTT